MDIDTGTPTRAAPEQAATECDPAADHRALLVADGAAWAGRPHPCPSHCGGRSQHRPPGDLSCPVLDDRWAHHAAVRLAIRPRPGFRLGLAAAIAAVVGAALVLLRDPLSVRIDPDVFVGLLGISAVLTGLLPILGGFAAEERFGRRWTLGAIVLGTLEVGLGVLLLLTNEVDPDLLVPIVAAWGAVSGTLLLAEGLRLHRFARRWRASDAAPHSRGPATKRYPRARHRSTSPGSH